MANPTHVLYRFYDHDGRLLYVGITNSPSTRFRSHRAKSAWYSKVARGTMEYFHSRQELAAAEIKAIQTEKPKYNEAYSTVSPPNEISSTSHSHSPSAVSVFGADAHRFKSPDAIASDDETDDIETLDALYPPRSPRTWQPLPCLKCHSTMVFRSDNDTVQCDSCLHRWPWQEWYQLNYRFPKP